MVPGFAGVYPVTDRPREAIRQRAIEARRTADYSSGVADALEWVLVADPPCDNLPEVSTVKPSLRDPFDPHAVASKPGRRRPIQVLVLDILRTSGEWLTPSELVRHAHRIGHDLLRDSVVNALLRARDRRVVERRQDGRYRVLPPDGREEGR